MIPQHRLETLLEQAKSMQRINCVYHASDTPISLLADCACDPSAFPSITTHILTEHTDEIWRLEFSHDGLWLATAGRDKTAIIWNVKVSSFFLAVLTSLTISQDGFALDKVLREHVDAVSSLAWSPDDSILLTAAESLIKLWDTAVRLDFPDWKLR